MVEIIINDRKAKVPPEYTILEAALEMGVNIPNLCYDDELTSTGSCRLCTVRVQGKQEPVIACTTKVSQGMVVETDTKDIRSLRKAILELLLANHPKDCLVCDRAGACKLQEYAYWYDADYDFFKEDKHRFAPDLSSPHIFRDANKCVLCGKCVRVCGEIMGNNALELDLNSPGDRVIHSRPQPDSSCTQCGNCIAVCPVGALTETEMMGGGRFWETETVSTVCPDCGVGCSLDLRVREGSVLGVSSNPHSKVNGRFLCGRGRFSHQRFNPPERLLTPQIRKDNHLEAVSWAEALAYAAAGLKSIREKSGGKALAVLGSARCTNEESYLVSKFARAALGTNNIDNYSRLVQWPAAAALERAFGCTAMTNSLGELAGAEFILAVGPDLADAHPVAGIRVRQAVSRGSHLVVVDSEDSRLDGICDEHLAPKTGTRAALFGAMAHVIISENLWDRKFVRERCRDLRSLWSSAEAQSPEWAAKLTGVPAEKIRQVARKYAVSETAMILYTVSTVGFDRDAKDVAALENLALLVGKIGRESCGICPLGRESNVQGACDMGMLPDYLTGYQKISHTDVREKFEREWRCNLAEEQGLAWPQIMEAVLAGEIRGTYVVGADFICDGEEAERCREAMQRLEFLVVQDAVMTETARQADVLLPACGFAERDGTFTNSERRVQRVRKAVDPRRDSRPGVEIIHELASAMGCSWRQMQPRDVMKEIAGLTPLYGGMTYSRIGQGGLQWPCLYLNHPGERYLYGKKFFSGRARFQRVEFQDRCDLPSRKVAAGKTADAL